MPRPEPPTRLPVRASPSAPAWAASSSSASSAATGATGAAVGFSQGSVGRSRSGFRPGQRRQKRTCRRSAHRLRAMRPARLPARRPPAMAPHPARPRRTVGRLGIGGGKVFGIDLGRKTRHRSPPPRRPRFPARSGTGRRTSLPGIPRHRESRPPPRPRPPSATGGASSATRRPRTRSVSGARRPVRLRPPAGGRQHGDQHHEPGQHGAEPATLPSRPVGAAGGAVRGVARFPGRSRSGSPTPRREPPCPPRGAPAVHGCQAPRRRARVRRRTGPAVGGVGAVRDSLEVVQPTLQARQDDRRDGSPSAPGPGQSDGFPPGSGSAHRLRTKGAARRLSGISGRSPVMGPLSNTASFEPDSARRTHTGEPDFGGRQHAGTPARVPSPVRLGGEYGRIAARTKYRQLVNAAFRSSGRASAPLRSRAAGCCPPPPLRLSSGPAAVLLGRSQAVRQRVFGPAIPGSNPGAPANTFFYLNERLPLFAQTQNSSRGERCSPARLSGHFRRSYLYFMFRGFTENRGVTPSACCAAASATGQGPPEATLQACRNAPPKRSVRTDTWSGIGSVETERGALGRPFGRTRMASRLAVSSTGVAILRDRGDHGRCQKPQPQHPRDV